MTNFPESMSAKKLFHACSQYGHVANIARFQRPVAKKDEDGGKKTFTFPVPKEQLKSKVEGRIAWVEVEGVPFKLWSGNTFSCITNKWGKLLDVDDQEET
nr:nucleotide-binding alpha-beta plait domain-containing protein [Tanacetum cinerariifolium]